MWSTWFCNKGLNGIAKANPRVAYMGSKIFIKRIDFPPNKWRRKLKHVVGICFSLEIAFHQCHYLTTEIWYLFLYRSMFSFRLHCNFCTVFGEVALNVPLWQEIKLLVCTCACREVRRFHTMWIRTHIKMSNASTYGPSRKIPPSLVIAVPVKVDFCITLMSRGPFQKKRVATVLSAKIFYIIF